MTRAGQVHVVTTSWPQHPGDFAGHFVHASAECLRRDGLDVQVWPLRIAPTGLPEALARAPLRTGARALAHLAGLRRLPLAPGDVVVAHWLPVALPLLDRAPTLAWAHGSDVALLESLPRPLGRQVARHLDTRAAALAFVSHDLRARFAALLGRTPRIPHWHLPMGVAPAMPDDAYASHLRHLAAGRPIVATVGRLVPLKGYDVLAHALAHLPCEVAWLAAGDGPERTHISEISSHFIHLGVLDPPRRDALLAVADVFVQPSRPVGRRTEGTPVAVLEALQSGVPVVASALGGLNELGVCTVPPEDPEALARAIHHLLAHPAAPPSVARFAWPVVGADHQRAVRWLLQRAGRSRGPGCGGGRPGAGEAGGRGGPREPAEGGAPPLHERGFGGGSSSPPS